MKVLLPASEVAPILKLGGLGDVLGSLPKALEKIGVNADVIIPYYSTAHTEKLKVYKSIELAVPFENDSHVVEVYKTKLPCSGVDVLLLRNQDYFALGGKSAFLHKNAETRMFAFFDRAVTEYVKSKFNTYDVVHCHDWHTGLIPYFLKTELADSVPPVLFTIHNLLYQGVGGLDLVAGAGIVPGTDATIDWDTEDGDLNMLLQGIVSADYVSTVSPSYAKEIVTKEYGGGLSDVLKAREGRLVGILNGIDYSMFPRNFGLTDWRRVKASTKAELQRNLGLEVASEKPLFAFIGRLDPNQKGLALLLETVPAILAQGGQFVLLGAGDSIWEEKFRELQRTYSNNGARNMSCTIAFDTSLSQKIYQASDFLLVPSKYEPCGLIQMIAMWYGVVPVVHNTGGLKDTVTDGVTGIKFEKYTTKAFEEAVAKAFSLYHGQNYSKVVEAALQTDFGWEKSSDEYKKLYEVMAHD